MANEKQDTVLVLGDFGWSLGSLFSALLPSAAVFVLATKASGGAAGVLGVAAAVVLLAGVWFRRKRLSS